MYDMRTQQEILEQIEAHAVQRCIFTSDALVLLSINVIWEEKTEIKLEQNTTSL